MKTIILLAEIFLLFVLIGFVAPTSSGSTVSEDAIALASRHHGAQIYNVVGNEMKPALRDGDVVVTVPINIVDIKLGMLAVVNQSNGTARIRRLLTKQQVDNIVMIQGGTTINVVYGIFTSYSIDEKSTVGSEAIACGFMETKVDDVK